MRSKIIKQKYWMLKIYRLCRNCGDLSISRYRMYTKKPKSDKDRIKYIIDQYHCVNI